MKLPDWFRIRSHYARHHQAIMEAGKNAWGIDPYAWDLEAGIELSPIERGMWHDIRCAGIVMYPQFPVERYFVDFANPVAKVAIECDGAAWHADKDKDMLRQKRIENLGWTVYRASGADCFKDDRTEDDEYGRERSIAGPVTMLIRQINQAHDIALRGSGTKLFDPLESIFRGVANES
jgi:hypothetical protein